MNDFTTKLPRQLYRAADVQRLDRIAIDDYGIDGFRLMQSAGAAAFTALLDRWPQTRHLRVFVGSGNNSGDGYVVARLAVEQGIETRVIQLASADRLQGDARRACDWASEKALTTCSLSHYMAQEDADPHTVIVDALLGTGLARDVSGDYASAIRTINDSGKPVLAIDIPSGLSADTGCPLGDAVRADLTVSFIGMKQGLLTGMGRDYVGTLLFSDLDIPGKVYANANAPEPSAWRIDINDATRHLLPRARASHKGNHGHVLVVGGDSGYGGAPLLAAEAALRAGAGLVSLITRSVHRPATLARRPELMVQGTEDPGFNPESLLARADVIVVGPGLGQSDWSRGLMQLVLAAQLAQRIPLVIDADGLRLLAEKSSASAGARRDNWVLTPHPGEAAQLLGSTVASLQADRFAAVRALQARWGGSCLLKGSGSLICEGNSSRVSLSTEGNAGMATAGMGDVLSGIIGALVAQGLSLADSLRCAVVIHGEAADLAREQGGERGMLATDLFPHIRQLVNPSTAWQA